MDSDSSDDEYWGSYERLPQETSRLPYSSFSQGRDLSDPALPSRKLSAGSIGSTPSTCSQETVELEPGTLISVGRRSFELHSLLGVGSFGSVWRASCNDSGATVALKEILTLSKESMEAAKLEAQRLHALSDLQDTHRSPAFSHLLAAATGNHGTGYRTVMVMEQVAGEPLQRALEGGQLLIPNGHPIAQAFHFVGEMLQQLAGIMQPLSQRFLHRDANSQNILVQASSGQYEFGLIDFGLAIDATSFSCGWRGLGAAGDGRFWTTSSWIVFTNGPDALTPAATIHFAQHIIRRHWNLQDLQWEYRTQLDLHSIGVSALQALVILAFCEDSGSHDDHVEVIMQSLRALREAWTQYWCYASDCWERVLDAFNRDARGEVKAELRQEMVHETFASHLVNLREKLVEVSASLESKDMAGGLLGDPVMARRVVEALLLMITPRLEGEDDWEQVLHVMGMKPKVQTGSPAVALDDEVLRVEAPGKWER